MFTPPLTPNIQCLTHLDDFWPKTFNFDHFWPKTFNFDHFWPKTFNFDHFWPQSFNVDPLTPQTFNVWPIYDTFGPPFWSLFMTLLRPGPIKLIKNRSFFDSIFIENPIKNLLKRVVVRDWRFYRLFGLFLGPNRPKLTFFMTLLKKEPNTLFSRSIGKSPIIFIFYLFALLFAALWAEEI